MRVIGLDLGTTMGYAYTDGYNVVPSQTGTISFARKRNENNGWRFKRFLTFIEEITSGASVRNGIPDIYLFYEEVVYHRGADAAHLYGSWVSLLQMHCDQHEIAYSGVPIGTIKKRATGSGRASKADMILAAKTSWAATMTHDQADAAWVLQCGLDKVYPKWQQGIPEDEEYDQGRR